MYDAFWIKRDPPLTSGCINYFTCDRNCAKCEGSACKSCFNGFFVDTDDSCT